MQDKITSIETLVGKQRDEVRKDMENQMDRYRDEAHRNFEKTSRELMDKIENQMEKQKVETHRDLEKVTGEIKELQKEVNNIKQNVQQKVETQIDSSVKQQEKKWAEALTKQVDVELKTRASDVQKMQSALAEAREIASETQDKENRRNNIIMYRAEESSAATTEERHSADVTFSLGLFNAIHSGVDREDIIKVVRLGRRVEDGGNRPLLVQLGSRLPKNLIMENLNKLKQAEPKYKAVIVAHDMTKKEREECKALVEEAKTKTAEDTSGEWIFVVRGHPGQMKILKVKKSR